MIKKRLTSNELKFYITAAGRKFLDYKMNGEILGRLKTEPLDEKPRTYKSNWLRLVTRMDNTRMPKIRSNLQGD